GEEGVAPAKRGGGGEGRARVDRAERALGRRWGHGDRSREQGRVRPVRYEALRGRRAHGRRRRGGRAYRGGDIARERRRALPRAEGRHGDDGEAPAHHGRDAEAL